MNERIKRMLELLDAIREWDCTNVLQGKKFQLPIEIRRRIQAEFRCTDSGHQGDGIDCMTCTYKPASGECGLILSCPPNGYSEYIPAVVRPSDAG